MPDYAYYRAALSDLPLPAAFVDLDLLDANIGAILAAAGKMPIRIASKSIRCSQLIRYILNSSPQFCGIMSFTVRESLFLAQCGFDNILLGYPTVDERELTGLVEANRSGRQIIPMVDSPEHLEVINRVAEQRNYVQPICVDIDMSTKFPLLHFGVHRSPIQTLEQFKRFLNHLSSFVSLKLVGLMGYEAQIAGVGDANPANGLKNRLIPLLKRKSIQDFTKRRQDMVQHARDSGIPISIVNGGGTGSVDSTIRDSSITEVTVGSGFYSPALFDYYNSFHYQPAMGFALQVVRKPMDGMFTLSGGGYIASGSSGVDKQPAAYLPRGIQLVENEGMGEVQTPIYYRGVEALSIGDPILFRHAKAGELCERFRELHLIRDGRVIESVPTYRGENQCFL